MNLLAAHLTWNHRLLERSQSVEDMYRDKQFSIAHILLLMSIVASLIVWSNSWLMLTIVEMVAIFGCAEVLTRNLPKAIQAAMDSNCKRLDGSTSTKRASIELQAVRKLWWDMATVFVIVLLPTNAILWIVDTEIIPISIGIDSLSSFQISRQGWKENIRDEEQRFDKWEGQRSHASGGGSRKSMLWNYWPLMLLGGIIWVAACFLVIKTAYFHGLKEMLSSIQYRAQQYRLHDLAEPSRSRSPSMTGS